MPVKYKILNSMINDSVMSFKAADILRSPWSRTMVSDYASVMMVMMLIITYLIVVGPNMCVHMAGVV